MTGEERRDSMEREIFSNRSSCEPSSSVASSSVAVAGEEANAHVHVRESAAAPEQSGPVRESVPTDQSAAEDDEDVKWWNMEAVVDQLLFLIKKSAHRRQGDDGGNTQNNFASNNNNSTEEKKEKEKSSKKKKRSRGGGSSSSAHTCEVCGKAFAKGQSLGGHKRKHYDIQKLITDKRRAREKQNETPAPAAVERRGGHTVAAMVKIEEERMASSCNATFDLHNPALLLLQSVQLEGPSAANGARRPHDFDLNEPAAPEEEREKAPQPQRETERKDNNDADDLLSFRLWPKFDSQISN